MSNRDRAAEVLYLHDQSNALTPVKWEKAGDFTRYHYLRYADALIAAGLIHVGQRFCTKVANCRLADGHAVGCERT